MTAYRQAALACATQMVSGPRRPRDLKPHAENAYNILRGNVYGWFVRAERGLYDLTPAGREALLRWPAVADSYESTRA